MRLYGSIMPSRWLLGGWHPPGVGSKVRGWKRGSGQFLSSGLSRSLPTGSPGACPATEERETVLPALPRLKNNPQLKKTQQPRC